MSEMVERVAKAIHAKDYNGPPGEDEWECQRDLRMEMARSAIEAMREPTPGISDVAVGSIWHSSDEVWDMMIMAALK